VLWAGSMLPYLLALTAALMVVYTGPPMPGADSGTVPEGDTTSHRRLSLTRR
jgi:hypothetical protein